MALLGNTVNRPVMVAEKLDRETSGCMGVKGVRPVEMIVRPFQEFADRAGLAEQKVADLEEQIDAYRDLSTSLALDNLQPTGNRR
jgi:hypothetical protein